jgi:TP53 regulating kinase-like protein
MSEENESSSSTPTVGFQTSPRDQWSLLSQGAEAKVWKLSATGIGGNSNGNAPSIIICKERFSKAYRHPDLDERLTKSRCRSEARVLDKCAKKSDIRVPEVIRVEPPLLYIEYVEGPSLKSYLLDKTNQPRVSFPILAKLMGEMIGKVHNLGVIHGDLTSSNMLTLGHTGEDDVENSFRLVLIDFGLSKSTSSVEEQAVDLYVLERALESTHPDLPENFFDMILKAYAGITNCESRNTEKKHQQTTLKRLEMVRQRGRKRECFG